MQEKTVTVSSAFNDTLNSPRENEWFFLTNIPLRDSIISKYLFVRFLQAACQ